MIELKDFKNQIENNSVEKKFLIFKCADASAEFIIHQYLKHYRQVNDFDIEHLECLKDNLSGNLFDVSPSVIRLYETKTLDVFVEPNNSSITWIICRKIEKRLTSLYEDYIIEVDKLDDWQIKDFTSTVGSGVDEADLNSLLDIYGNNIYRLDNELAKIAIFEENERRAIFNQVKDQLFTDTSSHSIFDIVNCIVRRDYGTMARLYEEISNIDVEPYGLIKLLIDNFKKIIDVQLGKNPTAESLGMSGKQFWAIQKYSCGFYSPEELEEIFKMLNNIDFQIKTGYLDTKYVVDHLICRTLLI